MPSVLPRSSVKRDPVDGSHQATRRAEVGLQVGDLEQRAPLGRGLADSCRCVVRS